MSSSSGGRTAVIVDEHPLWLEIVDHVVQRADVEVAATSTSPGAILRDLDELQPDLLITGLRFGSGEIDGHTFVREARERIPGLKVIVLSAHDEQQHIDAAFAAGVTAYVLKTVHRDDLVSAVRQAFMHSIYMAGSRPATAQTPVAIPTHDESPGLTRRETEILRLVAEGHTNAQLARMLWVTEQTVKFHLSNIYRKLGVSNRTEASRWAQLNGILRASAVQAA
jgi:NarL family two-component system response regulator LiaR